MAKPACFMLLAISSIVPLASARPLLQTGSGAETEPVMQALLGKAAGLTVKQPDGKGGPCFFTGRGGYVVDDSGDLRLDRESDCGGVIAHSTQLICHLSGELRCAAGGQYAHGFELTDQGLRSGARLLAWQSAPTDVEQQLRGLRNQIQARQSTPPQPPAASGNPDRLAAVCESARSSFSLSSTLAMARQRRPDVGSVCDDGVLQRFLATAHPGDIIAADSRLGQCFSASGLVSSWSGTRCRAAARSQEK